MKHLYLVLTLGLACFMTHAQTLYPRIGITASVNTYRPPNYDVKPKLGFLVGVGYNIELSDLISLQAELDYVQKSFESNYSNTTTIQYGEDLYALHEKGSAQYAISYLELPILIKARILHDDFFVLGGFSVGMGLGGSQQYTYDATSSYLDPLHNEGSGKIRFGSEPSTNTENIYFDNQWDIGFHVGLGALILKRIQIECRYSSGIINLRDNSDSKNRCFQISLATPLQL
jgi:hypothetical protein